MNKTDEQVAIIDHVGTKQHFVARARAGTGKTSTGKMICNSKKSRKIRYVAFTVANANDLKAVMPPNVECSTWNSFGARCFTKRPELDKWKMPNIVSSKEEYDIRRATKNDTSMVAENRDSMTQLCNLMKNYSLDPKEEDVIYLLDNYEVSPSLPRDKIISDCLQFVRQSDNMTHKIDFTDQIRFPVMSNTLKSDVDLFIVDEQQDNTRIRNIGMEQLSKKGVQVGAFGDDLQSMYGFMGADNQSMDFFINLIGQDNIYPLTINFRCGKNIIIEAQKIVPDIKYWDESPDGVVNRIATKDFSEHFKEGDVAISRFNKVIIPACFKLIKEGKKATIQGRDFGEQLKKMVQGFKATDIDTFYKKIALWLERQSKYIEEGFGLDAIIDKHDCLKFFADSCETVEKIYETIDAIFQDGKEGYKFTTGHRAKGLEWDNVFILDSTKFKMRRANMRPWQHQQETNILYVAITRAKKSLTFVG